MRILWLVGMMGSGKTVVGKTVAHRIGLPFIDTDCRVVTRQGASIASMWATAGEEAFRDLESEELVRIVNGAVDTVVATGGGAVLRSPNVDTMRSNGMVVWLTAPVEALLDRVGDDQERPLLGDRATDQRLRALLDERSPAYQGAAHYAVETTGRTPDEVAEEVIRLWNDS